MTAQTVSHAALRLRLGFESHLAEHELGLVFVYCETNTICAACVLLGHHLDLLWQFGFNGPLATLGTCVSHTEVVAHN